VFLKEAKHFYREDAKTAKRQKGRRKKNNSHGKTRNQNAQAEERLDLRIREGDEGARGGK
jgi:hypothetical protein